MFTVSADPSRKLVTIRIEGMLTPEEVSALYHAEHGAIRAMGCRLGEHLALVDLTACKLQLQDVAAAFQARMEGRGKARRLALFTGSSLAAMQARRITKRPGAQVFASRAEAEAWLFAAEQAAA